VDAVYDSDPRVNSRARKFTHLSYIDALNLRLKVMDSTALSLCMDNKLPIVVFDLGVEGNIRRVIEGCPIGTLVS
ncbi:MAG TPA: UMP kinase, partial [Chloroflexota bacterium]|nr:UMP kinase [Chloroflexota bacterium]